MENAKPYLARFRKNPLWIVPPAPVIATLLYIFSQGVTEQLKSLLYKAHSR
ncbi:MAG: hypothetical protein IM485_20405 [Microcystis sp. M169S2]|nr:hypothetical protein [Microcystis sp. M169S2]